MKEADIGLIGLGVMGRNLALNMNDHGYALVVYDRFPSQVDSFINDECTDRLIKGAYSYEQLVAELRSPHTIMLMIRAGQPVDTVISSLLPFLNQGDIIIDGGNSDFRDTIRRYQYLGEKGIHLIGMGISGGEEGARFGPSIMPGGSSEAWTHISELFVNISAKSKGGAPCCKWMGNDGAGHFVKTVHNGIEYGDMQLISETYHLMRDYLGLHHSEIQNIFLSWNSGVLDSYLIKITSDILGFLDEDGNPLVEKIMDKADQKGTGCWAAMNSFDLGVPLTLINEAVMARFLSVLKDERIQASKNLKGPKITILSQKASFLNDLHDALYSSKIISYTQGFMLLRSGAKKYKWNFNYADIASTWQGGCIIRSAFLDNIQQAYENDPLLVNLLFDPFFKKAIETNQAAWRRVVAKAFEIGIPIPAFSSALAFYDGYRTKFLPANLIQAQRDYFGAHTYQRLDQRDGRFVHTDWSRYKKNK